ncbi:NrfD/PsrC family molybdoenzyme membrane anchor subunit [Spongiactinospora sp. TRM90649]|uniref:NrfD/PsrC family molybdoenzyme membrane anchor subunit n=1 Tax=Spongiactinospora sp. TRM90649 TaxID=3031114 RepID=UPI0023F8D954|nr:NrfD/PsrC family molybdoenzyme membrane anchor subunit [Spongiactinospora sp. TRM90649]MDF5752045.1 polysulfide reductase NrfD [Spongiactinospora sp. TRM90649]
MTRERAMVPDPEFRSYYGQPIIKPPIWHEPHMPVYLYLGGLSGASSLLAATCELAGRPRLAAPAKITAALAGTAGAGFLVAELGRPERFLNMLRVFKPSSPMSVGSWILAAQSGLAAVAAGSEVTGLLPVVGNAAGLTTGITGPLMATYTAVLVADTAVPSWHAGHRELPFLFAGSALASAAAVAMVVAPPDQAGPARGVAILGAAVETAAGEVMERRLGLLAEPYRIGSAGRLMRAARALTVGGGLLAAVAGFSSRRAPAVLSAAALTAGALCTRFAVLRAGRTAAMDPKYTVVPQREGLERRRRDAAG